MENHGTIASAINLEYVKNLAQAGHEGALQEVGEFHESLFLHLHGEDLEKCRQRAALSEDRLDDLSARLRDTRERLTGENPNVPVVENGSPDVEPSSPWNMWDRTMFFVAGFAVICLLVFGVFNISFNLLESGIVTFSEHPIRAYLWAALLPVGALAVKIGWDLLGATRKRDVYVWTCLSIGFLALITWVAAYASVYPSLSMTTEERIASLSVGGASAAGGVKTVDMVIVAAQAVAEICLSAALGIYMTQLYSRHRPVKLVINPTFQKLDQERRTLEEKIEKERMSLAGSLGQKQKLEHQLKAFVSYAKSLFQREVALRRDRGHQKRQLLDDITNQLKSQLAAADDEGTARNGDEFNTDEAQRLTLDSQSS